MVVHIPPKRGDTNTSESDGGRSSLFDQPEKRRDPLIFKDTAVIVYTEDNLKAIRDFLVKREGFDLDSYKDKCIQRRISFRIRTSGCKSVEDYIELLKKREDEVKKLLNALTINVTEFFRNDTTFEKLKDVIFPDIFAMKEKERIVKIWSAGCASGEEPYTIAIILKEYFPEEMKRFNISITATDVDEGILKKAAEGLYPKDRMAGVSPHMKSRFFHADGESYRLSDEIKRMVSFEREDIFQEGLHRDNDLIVCRNLLIYFSKERQEWVLNEFWKGLRPGGFLVLGRAEILVGDSRKMFLTVCPRERMYRKPY